METFQALLPSTPIPNWELGTMWSPDNRTEKKKYLLKGTKKTEKSLWEWNRHLKTQENINVNLYTGTGKDIPKVSKEKVRYLRNFVFKACILITIGIITNTLPYSIFSYVIILIIALIGQNIASNSGINIIRILFAPVILMPAWTILSSFREPRPAR